ncbi:TolC family protein [Pedobacter polysacchareus]|uniref:TolC family protein n=1 Tax=Pedobacter polysacchareus TaxID=2861973 RepID=UPI001C99CF7A|nr:TolC family protein [Pedobacter polysacchareus]
MSAVLTAFSSQIASAQDTLYQKISIPELFKMAETNNQQLKISRIGMTAAGQRLDVAKTQRNPVLTAAATASYIGDVTVFNNDFSGKTTVPMPHFGNSFALQASQTVFKGGAINNNIAIAGLQEQLAGLAYEKNSLDVKILLAGNYFDLFKMYNQRGVYQENIRLAQLRLFNINKMYKSGMVTKNDVIRNELLITNLGTAVQQLNNNIDILSQQLSIALGLSDQVYILPDTTILSNKPNANGLQEYLDLAYQQYPELRSAELSNRIAERNVALAKADRLPSINLNAGNSMVRPLTTSMPARDMYSNGWQAGVGVSFNISSLYNAPKNISLAKTQQSQQLAMAEQLRQNTEISVKAAFIKHREAKQLLQSAEKSLQLATENFRIVEKKYLNQMALLTDLMDATNVRLEAELQQKNAEISIIYTYYQLQKTTGSLN